MVEAFDTLAAVTFSYDGENKEANCVCTQPSKKIPQVFLYKKAY